VGRFGLGDEAAGTFMFLASGARMLAGLICSQVSDRIGHRRTLAVAAGLSATACAVASVAPTPGSYAVVFVLVGLVFGAAQTSQGPQSMALAPAEGRIGFFSVLMLATLPVALASQIGGGALADAAGFRALFAAAGAAGVLAVFAALNLPDRREAESAGEAA
jgi:MFS transporter, AAHS family, benzoate transport protein